MNEISFWGETREGVPVEVFVQWNEGFTLTVLVRFHPNYPDEFLYWWLNDLEQGIRQTNDEHKQILERLGIAVPDGFWERVEQKVPEAHSLYHHGWRDYNWKFLPKQEST